MKNNDEKIVVAVIVAFLATVTGVMLFIGSHNFSKIEDQVKKVGAAKPLTDYKFWYIKRCDDVHICEVAVRFYEGAVNTLPETQPDGSVKDVTKYRRTKRLQSADISYAEGQLGSEANGNEVKIYTSADFGTITTDDELRLFLNGEISKDAGRTPIPEQTGQTIK